jgi:hypothetical protein
MEFRVETGADRAVALGTFVVDDINWKNKYIGSETIRWQIPRAGNTCPDL